MQTAEPTLGDTSVVSQSVTNNRCVPHVGRGTREKWGYIKKFSKHRHCAPPHTCKLLPTPLCLSVAYIGPKSRTERPMTKIGIEVGHIRRHSDTTFKVKRSKGQGYQAALVGCSSHQLTYLDHNSLYAQPSEPRRLSTSTKSPPARCGGIVWRPSAQIFNVSFRAYRCLVSRGVCANIAGGSRLVS